jgi:hypothetical protein
MNGLGAFPWIGKRFVRRGTYVAGDETVHGLSRNVCGSLACACDLGDLRIKHALLITVDLKCCQHVNLFN